MRIRLKVALVALLWMACTKKDTPEPRVADAGPTSLTENEPNDRSDQAQRIVSSSVVSAQLRADTHQLDEDWFELQSATPVTVDVTAGNTAAVDLVLEVLDLDRNRLVLVNSAPAGQEERLPNLGLSGKAYLRVSAAKKGMGGAYTLKIIYRTPEVGFEIEPNDRAVESNALNLATPVSAYIGHAGDEDWFRIEFPLSENSPTAPTPEDAGVHDDAGPSEGLNAPTESPPADTLQQALRIDVSHLDGVRFSVSVLSEAEAPLLSITGKEGDSLSLRNVGVRATDRVIYVVVKSAWTGTGAQARRGFDAERSYTLSVSEEPAGTNAESEPNDEVQKATILPMQGYREGMLTPKTDVDYYVLKTDKPVITRLHLSGVDRMDMVLSLLAIDTEGGPEKVLAKSNDGTLKEPEYLNNIYCAETCFFKVEGALKKVEGKWVRDYENPDLPYRLSVSTLPDDGTLEREPNNLTDNATVLELGRPIRGTIFPKKDVDSFKLDLSNRVVRTPLRIRLTGLMKVDVGLYLHRQDADGRLSLVQTADRAKGDAAESIDFSADPGFYIVEVRDAKNRDSNFQDAYQLTVEE